MDNNNQQFNPQQPQQPYQAPQQPQQPQQPQYQQPYQAPQQPQYQVPQQVQYQPGQYAGYTPAPVIPGKSQATVGLVLGIISLVFCWLGLVTWVAGSVIALVLGVIGAIMSVKGKKLMPPQQSGMATAGLVCSIIGIVLSAIFTICAVAAYVAVCQAASYINGLGNIYNSFDW